MNIEKTDLRVAIVIPVLNEAEEIASVLEGLRFYGTPIVVDDGSVDGTGEIARIAGATVVTHLVNRGYDAALTSGLLRALADGFDVALTVDGDGQHDSSCVERMIAELKGGADLVVGIRDQLQRFSEHLFSLAAFQLWGIADPLCGMKGYRLARLMGVAQLCSYKSIGTELTIRAARSGWQIAQVPILTKPRNGVSRFGSGVYANWLICRALLIGVVTVKAFSGGARR